MEDLVLEDAVDENSFGGNSCRDHVRDRNRGNQRIRIGRKEAAAAAYANGGAGLVARLLPAMPSLRQSGEQEERGKRKWKKSRHSHSISKAPQVRLILFNVKPAENLRPLLEFL